MALVKSWHVILLTFAEIGSSPTQLEGGVSKEMTIGEAVKSKTVRARPRPLAAGLDRGTCDGSRLRAWKEESSVESQ